MVLTGNLMEQSAVEVQSKVLKSGVATPVIGNVTASQLDLVSEDLATFLVAHHILTTGISSVSAIKIYFKRAPEVLEVVDSILGQLENADLISVEGDIISVNQRFIDIGGSWENLQRFIPRLFKLSAERVITDAIAGEMKGRREALRYYVFPNDPESSIELQAANLEYKAKLLEIMEKADRKGRKAEGIRLIGTFNCALRPEDFV